MTNAGASLADELGLITTNNLPKLAPELDRIWGRRSDRKYLPKQYGTHSNRNWSDEYGIFF